MTLIRLRWSASWFKSSLGSHVGRYVFFRWKLILSNYWDESSRHLLLRNILLFGVIALSTLYRLCQVIRTLISLPETDKNVLSKMWAKNWYTTLHFRTFWSESVLGILCKAKNPKLSQTDTECFAKTDLKIVSFWDSWTDIGLFSHVRFNLGQCFSLVHHMSN